MAQREGPAEAALMFYVAVRRTAAYAADGDFDSLVALWNVERLDERREGAARGASLSDGVTVVLRPKIIVAHVLLYTTRCLREGVSEDAYYLNDLCYNYT